MHAQQDILRCERTRDDDGFVLALFCEVREAEFRNLQLPPPVLESLLAMQYRAQTSSYAAQFPHVRDEVLQVGGERIGRLLVNRTESSIDLLDVAITSAWRRQGIGTHLLRGLIGEARQRPVPLRQYVRAENPAARLYQRLGFVVTGGDDPNLSMELQSALG